MPGHNKKNLDDLKNHEELRSICCKFGFFLTDIQSQQLYQYLSVLCQWNKVINLVGTHTMKDTLIKLIFDSFYLYKFINKNLSAFQDNNEIWDLGSGAGIPGIPLRMLWNKGTYWLIESRDKRTAFLLTVLAKIPLQHVYVFHGRAETFMANRQASLIISRAFMPWEQVLDMFYPALRTGGSVIFLLNNIVKNHDQKWESFSQLEYIVDGKKRHIVAFKKV